MYNYQRGVHILYKYFKFFHRNMYKVICLLRSDPDAVANYIICALATKPYMSLILFANSLSQIIYTRSLFLVKLILDISYYLYYYNRAIISIDNVVGNAYQYLFMYYYDRLICIITLQYS